MYFILRKWIDRESVFLQIRVERQKNWCATWHQKERERPSSQMSCSTNVKIGPMNMWKACMPHARFRLFLRHFILLDFLVVVFIFALYIEHSFRCAGVLCTVKIHIFFHTYTHRHWIHWTFLDICWVRLIQHPSFCRFEFRFSFRSLFFTWTFSLAFSFERIHTHTHSYVSMCRALFLSHHNNNWPIRVQFCLV